MCRIAFHAIYCQVEFRIIKLLLIVSFAVKGRTEFCVQRVRFYPLQFTPKETIYNISSWVFGLEEQHYWINPCAKFAIALSVNAT